jgi:hypothetical protein
MKIISVLKLKENVLRSLLIGIVVGGLPYIFNGDFQSSIATFILVSMGAFLGNFIYDLIKFFIAMRKFKKEVEK